MLYRLSPITDQHKISPCNIYAYSTPEVGSITSRCSGNEPTLTPEKTAGRVS